ncbi:MAG TPA: hypothetical protein VFV89_02950 [Nocardioides sp.]|uniref:hypothetical protein n=1 Tax=Nocardioides sp. TaxID=35761 RepID=UPI002E32DAFF|nr:hypothetical protein [Nocardioides sp.]HEX5086738.1 hypothetical protein [Nocardioides sp.]
MEQAKPARPPQVTVAGWMVVAGSVLVVLSALDQGAGLHSLDTREAVQKFLADPPGDQLGLSLQGGLMAFRVLLTVAAVTAAASAILGYYALQRSKAARMALTVLAVPLLLTGFSFQSGGVFPAMVAAAVVMMWFQPGRDWFNGITRPATPAAPAPPPTPPEPAPVDRDRLLALPPPTRPPLHPTPYAGHAAAARATRPASITWACVITWTSTVTVFVVFALTLVQFLATPEVYVDEFHRQNPELSISDSDLKTLLLVLSIVFMVWSALAAGLAVLVWRRVAWAAVALGVSAALACLTLVPIVASVATGILLLRPEARAWMRGRDAG